MLQTVQSNKRYLSNETYADQKKQTYHDWHLYAYSYLNLKNGQFDAQSEILISL